MTKIGFLSGADKNFPNDVMLKINSSKKGIKAEMLITDALRIDDKPKYSVIYDRISHKVPFYKNYLKLVSINGTKVVNNPFLCNEDSSFIFSLKASKVGILTPKSVLLPSKELPLNTSPDSYHNLKFPIDWSSIFDYIGFPAYLKSNNTYNYVHAYKIYNSSEFFAAYDLTGRNNMNLVESIDYDSYYKVLAIGDKLFIFEYDPSKPIHLRYGKIVTDTKNKFIKKINSICLQISEILEFSINSLEFGLKGDKLYLTSAYEPATIIEKDFFEPDIYNNIVQETSNYLIDITLGNKSEDKADTPKKEKTTNKKKAKSNDEISNLEL